MGTHILRFRKADKVVFDSIKNGEKTIETRAATAKFRKIKAGDILVFDCARERLEKEVKSVAIYKSTDELAGKVDFRKVMPFVFSVEEMKKVYYSFPNYKEKIAQFGLIAFSL